MKQGKKAITEVLVVHSDTVEEHEKNPCRPDHHLTAIYSPNYCVLTVAFCKGGVDTLEPFIKATQHHKFL